MSFAKDFFNRLKPCAKSGLTYHFSLDSKQAICYKKYMSEGLPTGAENNPASQNTSHEAQTTPQPGDRIQSILEKWQTTQVAAGHETFVPALQRQWFELMQQDTAISKALREGISRIFKQPRSAAEQDAGQGDDDQRIAERTALAAALWSDALGMKPDEVKQKFPQNPLAKPSIDNIYITAMPTVEDTLPKIGHPLEQPTGETHSDTITPTDTTS